MLNLSATAVACANIAFIKYWGNRDQVLNIPSNGSISMNLGGLETRTKVRFDATLEADQLLLNGQATGGLALERVCRFLDRVRELSGQKTYARVESENNFPTGVGIASSASAFAALSLAASQVAGLELSEVDLSRLARLGSGSACRSVPGGFVEWQAGDDDANSYACSIAAPDHWELVDCIAVVSEIHKPTASSQGHALANTSPLQASRVADAPRRLELCRRAILERDFEAFATSVELDSNLMHAVMISSSPALFYWQPATLAVLETVQRWRKEGLPVCYTVDAGPNVHVLCLSSVAPQVERRLNDLPGVGRVLRAGVGGPARFITDWQET